MSFCHESGSRVDVVLKFKVDKTCRKFEGKSLRLTCSHTNELTREASVFSTSY